MTPEENNTGLRINLNMPEIDENQLGSFAQSVANRFAPDILGDDQGAMPEAPQAPQEQQLEPELDAPPPLFREDDEDKIQPRPEAGDNAWMDIAKSPLRGVLAAGQSLYELADTITADILPDIDIRIAGRSTSAAGKVVEGMTQFVTGFLISGGVIGKALKGATMATKALANPLVGGAIKGAVTDFAFMDVHQDRLSNLIQSVPALQNPITEYLSNDKDEGDLEARLKNALEGSIIGVGIDTLVAGIGVGVKALKKGQIAKLEGKTPTEVQEIMAKETDSGIGKLKDTQAEPLAETAEGVKPKEFVELKDTGITYSKEGGEEIALASTKQLEDLADDLVKGVDGGPADARNFDEIYKTILSTVKDPEDVRKASLKLLETIGDRLKAKPVRILSDAVERLKTLTESFHIRGFGQIKSKEDILRGGINPQDAGVIHSQTHAFGKIAQAKASQILEAKANGSLTEEMFEDFREVVHHAWDWLWIQQKLGSEAGRALQTFNESAQKKFSKKGAELVKDGFDVKPEDIGKEYLEKFELARKEMFKLSVEGNKQLNKKQQIELMEKMAYMLSQAENPSEVFNHITKNVSTTGRFMDATLEYYINALLSYTSVMVNVFGSLITTVMRPFEFAVGAMFKDKAMNQMMMKQYGQMFADMGQAFQLFKRTLKDGTSYGRTSMESFDKVRAISAEKFGVDKTKHPIYAGLIDGLGAIHRFHGDLMSATDSSLKFLSMRGSIAGELTYKGVKQGMDGNELSLYVSKEMEKFFNQRGLVDSESGAYHLAMKEAQEKGLKGGEAYNYVETRAQAFRDKGKDRVIENARAQAGEATFTRSYQPREEFAGNKEDAVAGVFGQFGEVLEKVSAQYPITKFMIPFVRTPQQLLRWVSEHTPITGQMKSLNKRAVQEMQSADPIVRAGAYGRLYTGTMLWAMAGAAALSGRITGYGPQDPRERKALMATGWQPYSMKIGDKYVQFARLDPIASFFGIAADAVEQAKTGAEQDDEMHSILFQSAWLPVQKNILNKTFMRGMVDTLDILNARDDTDAARFVLNKVASFIPANLANAAAAVGDDFSVGQSSQAGDYLLRRIPGLTGLVDRKRNLLGEAIDVTAEPRVLDPINPFTVTSHKDDKIITEIARLKHPFAQPPKKLGGVVDLTKLNNSKGQTAYDRYIELTSTVKVGGSHIRNELGKLISSTAYKNLKDVFEDGFTSPKVQAINKVLRTYRARALTELLKEFPELQKQWGDKLAMDAEIRQSSGGARNFLNI